MDYPKATWNHGIMEINIYLRYSPGKCYTFQHESLSKRYTFSMRVRELFSKIKWQP